MATDNPKGGGGALALTLSARDTDFLRRAFISAQAGLLGDLAESPDGLRDPDRTRREARLYERLVASLSGALIESDWETLALLRETAWANDECNEYVRIVFEHRAFCALLRQLETGLR